MNDMNSPDYYRRRERQERDFADAAMSPGIRKIHLEFADHYAGLIAEVESAAIPIRGHLRMVARA